MREMLLLWDWSRPGFCFEMAVPCSDGARNLLVVSRRSQLKAREQLREARAATRARKAELRRLILLGSWLDQKMRESSKLEAQVRRGLDAYLTRPFDRELFGFEGDGGQAATRVELNEALAATRARNLETRRLILLGTWLDEGAKPGEVDIMPEPPVT